MTRLSALIPLYKITSSLQMMYNTIAFILIYNIIN